MLQLTALFLFTLFATFLTGTAATVYSQWTGGIALAPVVLPLAFVGGVLAFVARRYVARFCGNRVCAWLCVIGAVLAFRAFGDTAYMVKTWRLLSLRIGLTYADWYSFVVQEAFLWFGWVAFLIPFLWMRLQVPRAKLVIFVSGCCGLILARNLSGILSETIVYDVALLVLFITATLLLISFCKLRLTRCLAGGMGLLLLVGWYFGAQRTSESLLEDVYPFAPIAARDGVYTGEKKEGFTFKDGRIIRTEGLDESALIASQMIPVLYFPAENARIAVRSQTGDATFATAETGKLKGQYHAIWVEVPPAWMSTERDYYGKSALQVAKNHLTPDGILVYDNDGHALDAEMLMTRIAVMRKHFAYVQLWMTSRNHWQIVASRVPFSLDVMALSTLLDREATATALSKARIDAPLTLLSCCVIDDTARLDEFLKVKIKPSIPRGSAKAARKLLFDGVGGQRLVAAFEPYYDLLMPWAKVSEEMQSDMRDVFSSLRSARIYAMEGRCTEAAKVNDTDPYLQSLAERDCYAARSFEQMAEHDKALQLYRSAFTIARPRIADLLEAARIAQTSGKGALAGTLYAMAVEQVPTSPDLLMCQAKWYLDSKQPADAERVAKEAIRYLEQPEQYPREMAAMLFFIAQAITAQEGRETEGLALAKEVIQSTEDEALKASFMAKYVALLIDNGQAVKGIQVKRHWETYGELMPDPVPPPARP